MQEAPGAQVDGPTQKTSPHEEVPVHPSRRSRPSEVPRVPQRERACAHRLERSCRRHRPSNQLHEAASWCTWRVDRFTAVQLPVRGARDTLRVSWVRRRCGGELPQDEDDTAWVERRGASSRSCSAASRAAVEAHRAIAQETTLMARACVVYNSMTKGVPSKTIACFSIYCTKTKAQARKDATAWRADTGQDVRVVPGTGHKSRRT